MSDEIRTLIARYLATDFITWVVIIPLPFASLVTGLVESLGTESGARFGTTGYSSNVWTCSSWSFGRADEECRPGLRASATYRAPPDSFLCMSAASVASLAASRDRRARRS